MRLKSTLFSVLILVTAGAQAASLPQYFNFDGFLTDANDYPRQGTVELKLQIYSPGEDCLLYEEIQSGVALNNLGEFSVKVGAGNRSSSTADGGGAYSKIFQNEIKPRTVIGATCPTLYNPSSGDSRKLKVIVDGVALSPLFSLSSTPMATVAESVQGFGASDFVIKNASNKQKVDAGLKLGDTLQLLDTAGSSYVELKAPTGLTSYTLTMPPTLPTGTMLLQSSSTGVLSWVGGTTGTVNTVTAAVGDLGVLTAGGVVTLSLPIQSGLPTVQKGSATRIPQITVDTKGRITSLSEAVVGVQSVAGTVNDITATNSSGAVTLSLASVSGLPTGTIGSATTIPVITVDTKGRIATLSSVTAAGGGGGSFTFNGQTAATHSFALQVLPTIVGGGFISSLNSGVVTHELVLPYASNATATYGMLSNAEYVNLRKKDEDITGANLKLSSTGKLQLESNNSNNIELITNGTDPALFIKGSNGNVGIGTGTATPSSKLQVNGNVEATGFTIGGVPIGTAGGTSQWTTGTSSAIYYNAGKVGISTGTAVPSALLQVGNSVTNNKVLETYGSETINSDASGIAYGALTMVNTNTDPASGVSIDLQGSRPSSSTRFTAGRIVGYLTNQTAGSERGALLFATMGSGNSVTERMRVDDSGNVGIGTQSPSVRLDVAGGVQGTAAYQVSSDARFKREIASVDDSLDKIAQIRGVTYNFRTEKYPEKNFSPRRQLGVIAQEIEKIFPEAVSTDAKGMKSVAYSMLIAPLIEAIKDLRGQVIDLQNQLDERDKKLNEFEERLKRLENRP